MHILVATSNRSIVGGIETYLQELLPSLRGCGHEVGLLFEHPASDAPAIDGDGKDGPAWCANGEFLREVAAWRPDVVYCQGHTGMALDEALLNAFPCVRFAHDYQGTCISGQKCHGLPTLRPCGRVLGPSCLGLYLPRRCGGLNPLTMFRQYALQRAVNRYCIATARCWLRAGTCTRNMPITELAPIVFIWRRCLRLV